MLSPGYYTDTAIVAVQLGSSSYVGCTLTLGSASDQEYAVSTASLFQGTLTLTVSVDLISSAAPTVTCYLALGASGEVNDAHETIAQIGALN